MTVNVLAGDDVAKSPDPPVVAVTVNEKMPATVVVAFVVNVNVVVSVFSLDVNAIVENETPAPTGGEPDHAKLIVGVNAPDEPGPVPRFTVTV